jgi:uncharacterized Zn finger protein
MNCKGCQGLMVKDQLLDFEGTYGQMWATSWRCVNCGRVHDSVIEQNRLVRQRKVLVLPSGEPDDRDGEAYLEAMFRVRRAA